MACEPVESNHPDPFINRVELCLRLARQEILLQSADFPECIGMIECEKFFGHLIAISEMDFAESFCHLSKCRRIQPRARQEPAEWIDIAAVGHSAKQPGLDDRRAPSHERVVNDVAWFSEPLDEETRQLRFEASPIGNLVQTARGALFCRPKLVDVRGNR